MSKTNHSHDNHPDIHTDISHIRHTLAHILAVATAELHPGAKPTIGPAIDNGFYYDFDGKISTEDLPALEKKMKQLLLKWTEFSHKVVTADEARQHFADNPFKIELIDEIAAKNEKITLYTCGGFTDLCRGGHVDNPAKEIKPDSFKLTHVAGAYWRGDEKRPMLTRVYGLAFHTKLELDDYETMRLEAEARDHRKLGKELDLFVFSETVGKGLPLWTERGATIRRELERFIVDEEIRRDYKHVYTPDIANLDLYKKSGHYPYYKDSMYAPIVIDEQEYMLRPMTCPHHFELYLSKPRSYRELPMRIAELAKLYRYEQSGELSGLVRVRSFCLADAHIICADHEQAGEEVRKALKLIEDMAETFNLKKGKDFWYRLSLGDRSDDKKYYKDDAAWDNAESILRNVLKDQQRQADKEGSGSVHFVEAPNEAAFYGPKIDVQMKDVRGKENTAFTVQFDFVMPKRFDLNYTAQDGTIKQAVVVHRSSIGAIERVIAFLIENYAGKFPLWLSPTQVAVIPVGDAHHAAAITIHDNLRSKNIRSNLDLSSDNFGKKVRRAKTDLTPYFIIIGDKDIAVDKVTLESRDRGQIGQLDLTQILEMLKHEIESKGK